MNLNVKAALGVIGLAAALAAAIFTAAGTFAFWQAWIFLAVFNGASAVITVDLARHDRALLRRRIAGGPFAEKDPTQRKIITFISAGFIALIVVPALARRFGWFPAPAWVAIAGDVLIAAGFGAVLRVFRENSFTAATIVVAEGQRVIATGPYALVRHPMYSGALLYLLGTALALGSFTGLVPFAALLPALIWRLTAEERLLAVQLPGYDAYRACVTWRLVPGLY
jgi:protein-S-isoprenylcysteine O-methyltransferase Ste14